MPKLQVMKMHDFIYSLFKGKCMGLDTPCIRKGTEVVHIIPRSSGKSSENWDNLGLQCRECHDEYHRRGVSDNAILYLQERRVSRLLSLGRYRYV